MDEGRKRHSPGENVRYSEHPSMADAELLTLHGRKLKVTDEELAVMLEKAGGFKSRVAKQLGVTVSAICHRIQRSEYLRDACKTVEESILDLAEAALLKAAQNGEPWAVTFILKCKGRKRGWIERQDVVFNGELDAPPPPFVFELHDPAFVEEERKRQKEALDRTIGEMAIDVTPAEPVGKSGGSDTRGATGPVEPTVEVETDTWTSYLESAPAESAETGPGAAQDAPETPQGQLPPSATEAPTEARDASAPKPPEPPPAPKVPRTPSEAAAMRREREARERAAGQPQATSPHPSPVVPVAFPRR